MSLASRTPVRVVLSDRSFRRLWLAGALASAMRWLDTLVLGVFVFDLTGSAFLVALLFFTRQVPRILFALAIGTLADRIDRRRMLMVCFTLLTAVSALLGMLVATGRIEYWHLLAASFVAGTLWAVEFPVRRAMLGDVVPRDLIGRAMALDIGTSSLTRVFGPLTGGILLAVIGAEAAFFTQAVTFLLALTVLATLSYTPPERSAEAKAPLADLVDGVRYIRRRRLLAGAFLASLLMNIFGFPYLTMVPVIGKETLGLDAVGVGMLQSAEGFGALIGATLIASLAPTRIYTFLYIGGIAFFMTMVMLFSRSEIFLLSLVFLWMAGFGMASYTSMQTTLFVASAPPQLRGRVIGTASMALGGNPLGALSVGVTAELLGAPIATTLMSVEGLFALSAVVLAWPELRRRFSVPADDDLALAPSAGAPR
ncbi:MAG: MFS transporter [Chloroflexi bacterium]|nr:MFS transporter [Chloroflexota bacterium]